MAKTSKTTRTSNAYVATLNPMSMSDMLSLDALRAKIARQNKTSDKKLRVVVRGRAPIAKFTVETGTGGRTFGYDGYGNIVNGLANAQRLDVYVYERRS